MLAPVKVALVTGAAIRIGAAIAESLHAAGYNIAVHYRSSHDSAMQLVSACNSIRKDSACAIQQSLQVDGAARDLIDMTLQPWGRLDVLINNASVFRPTPVGTIAQADWDEIMTVNLSAPLFLAQAAAPHLADQEGSVINIADIHGERPAPRHSVYSISKAGLIMLTRSLAVELGPKVRVNAVSPGPILWPADASEEHKQQVVGKTSLKQSGEPTDVADAVLYLVGARYVTGQILVVDGGRLLTI